MIRPVLIILLACLTASPAVAHWDRTRWGMTPAEVTALYPAAFPAGDPAYRDPAKPVLGLPDPYVFDGQSFSLVQLFFRDRGRLSQVSLTTDSKADAVPGLLAWLERRYGRPTASEGSLTVPEASNLRSYTATWAAADGDRVKVTVLIWPNGDALAAVSWEPRSP